MKRTTDNLALKVRLESNHKLGWVGGRCTEHWIHNTKCMQDQYIWKCTHLGVHITSLLHLRGNFSCKWSIKKTIRNQQLKKMGRNSLTCNILSNKHLHINSHRLRTEVRETGLMPTALVDCGKKSSAKFLLIIVTSSWWFGIFLNISTICSVFLAISNGTELSSPKNWVCEPEGSSNQNS